MSEEFESSGPVPYTIPEGQKVTVEDMDKLVLELREARADRDAKDEIKKAASKIVSQLEGKVVAYLKELGRENYKTPDGTVYVQKVWSVGVPKADQDKLALLDWMKEQGIYNKYVTVNSRSLNSLYKTLVEEAEAKGELLQVPGLGAPSLRESLGLRKGK